jgi:DNA polymerase
MDERRGRAVNLVRAVRQQLESLQQAGVEQWPRPRHGDASSVGSSLRSAHSDLEAQTVAAAHATSAIARSAVATVPDPPVAMATPAGGANRASRQGQLAQVCAQVRSCQLCPQLVATRTQTVFGVGNPHARLCFFGEAPGADEDRLGEPFVGRAGQLLDKIIEACTLQRSDVYILNTVKCRPPGNRNPDPAEVANCRPFFERQLEIIRPEFICCLGLVAATALLDTRLPVGQLRGKLHAWRWAQVLVTYHPAYLLRNPEAKKLVWEDMKLLMKAMGIAL